MSFTLITNHISNIYNFISKYISYAVGTLLTVLLILSMYYIAIAPLDYQHKEYTLLLYLHAPIAWTGINLYILNAISSIVHLFYYNSISIKLSKTITFPAWIFLTLTVFTGSVWGYHAWGAFWVWDARLSSVFILHVFYTIKIIVLHYNNEDDLKLEILNILSFTLIPIIIFSVNIWNTIHQGSSLQGNNISPDIFTPLMFVVAFLKLYIITICYKRYQKIN